MSDIIDITVQETIDLVDITVTPNIIEVNVTRTSGGGAGSQTLAQTLDLGNQTGGENIVINNADAIELENTSLLKKGTYDFGGNGGISRICSNQYEDMWQNGFRHVFDQSGFIRNSSNGFDVVPDETFDVTLRFKVGSFWSLDNGTIYICTDATEGAAVWELYSVGATPTLQEVTDGLGNNITTNPIQIEDGLFKTLTTAYEYQVVNGNDFDAIALGFNGLARINDDSGTAFSQLLSFDTLTSNETLTIPNKSGTLATVDDIPTTTSQLTNDGADGVNPFITALDIPVAGEASTLVREVKNMTGATLTKGTVVYISGANGNKALVSKALATTDALSARTFGLLQSDILNNGLGNCVIIGDLSGINTSAFAEGAQLYLSGVTAGTFTDTRVLAPTHLVYVGKVTRVHPTQGQIEVQIQNGYELEEIHDVSITSVTNNQLLAYTSATSLWQNKNLIDILKDFNKTKGIYFFEEFMGNQGGSVGTNFGGVISTATGTGASCITTGSITNRTNQQGVVRAQTGTILTGQAGYIYGGVNLFRGTGTVSIETYATIETLSTSTERFFTIFGHIGVANYNNPANGIFFAYDEGGVIASGANAGSPNFKCVSINTLTRTFFTSSVPIVAGQWYKLRIDLNAAGTQAAFYIDGNLITTLTTNIPATTTAMGVHSVIVKTVGTTTRAMQTDYFNYEEIFTNPR
jgi:ribosomal protein L35AE/L33A